jgi:hypothetical protein
MHDAIALLVFSTAYAAVCWVVCDFSTFFHCKSIVVLLFVFMLFALFFCIFYVFFLGFNLLIRLRFVLVVKTCTTKDSTLSSSVLASDFDNVFLVSQILKHSIPNKINIKIYIRKFEVPQI